MADDAQAFEWRAEASLPVVEEVGDDGVELLLGRVPGLVQVVVDAGRVDGANGGFRVGIRGEKDTARIGIDRARALEHLDAAHSGHALVADDQSDRLIAGLELGQRVERGRAAGGAHDAIGGPILAAQVLDHGFQHAYVVVNRQEDGPCHKESVEPETGLIIKLLPSTIRQGPALLPGPMLALAECISMGETGWAGPNLVNGLRNPAEGILIPYFDLKAVISDIAGPVLVAVGTSD